MSGQGAEGRERAGRDGGWGHLADRVIDFLEARLGLLQDEARLELRFVIVLALALGVAIPTVLLGLQLVTAGALVLLSSLGAPLWLLLVAAGALFAASGLLLLAVRLRSLREHRFFPHTARELSRDHEWIRSRKSTS